MENDKLSRGFIYGILADQIEEYKSWFSDWEFSRIIFRDSSVICNEIEGKLKNTSELNLNFIFDLRAILGKTESLDLASFY